MNEAFNVNDYWVKRGRGYLGEQFPQEYHRLQERFLLETLRASEIPFHRILDLGCGFGRITRLLADEYPEAVITAIDLSEEQLENARRYCEGRQNVVFATYDFYSAAPIPGGHYDLAVAIEVFLHHPETFLPQFVRRLSGAARCIVNIDWSEEWPWPRPDHVWIHNYVALYRALAMDSVGLRLPERVDGLQQKLFFAARTVPKTIRALEPKTPAESLSAPPPGAQWYVQLQHALADLELFVPESASVILVDDDQWGSAAARLSPRRVLPFIERNGMFWGRPRDDAHAIEELTRMQRAGATHIAFVWHSFWWLEYYSDFARYLQAGYRSLVANDRVIIFRLAV